MATEDTEAQGHKLLHLALWRVGGRRDGAACPIMQQAAQCRRSRGIAFLTDNALKLLGCVFGLYGFDVFHFVWIKEQGAKSQDQSVFVPDSLLVVHQSSVLSSSPPSPLSGEPEPEPSDLRAM